MFFKQSIQLKNRIPIIIQKIEDKITTAIHFHNANPKANYLNSIKQNISSDVLKEYMELYEKLVIKVKDIHHRGCMNNLSLETKTILFYELCKVIRSSFILFCKEDANNIGSRLLEKQCNPNSQLNNADKNYDKISEDKKKLTNQHISFTPIRDIFIAVLLHYCNCNKTDVSDRTKYVLIILPKIESIMSIYLHSIISYSNVECQGGGHKRSNKQSGSKQSGNNRTSNNRTSKRSRKQTKRYK